MIGTLRNTFNVDSTIAGGAFPGLNPAVSSYFDPVASPWDIDPRSLTFGFARRRAPRRGART